MAVAFTALFVWLGAWQLSRAHQKQVLQAAFDAATTTPAVRLDTNTSAAGMLATRQGWAEGAYDPGTILFPEDPLKRAEIVWGDVDQRAHPARIEVLGDRSLWHTAEGITLGTTVHSLELLNGKPFTMNGFGWDYGGWVASWEEGRLGSALNNSLSLRMHEPGCRAEGQVVSLAESELFYGISGDGVFPASDWPAIRVLNPCVSRMMVHFDANVHR